MDKDKRFNFEIKQIEQDEQDDDIRPQSPENIEFEPVSPIMRKRQDKIKYEKKKKMKRRQFLTIFTAGMITGIILSSIFSLLLSNKEKAPTSPEIPPITTPETPIAPEVNEIVIDTALPEELMEGRNHSNKASEYAYDVKEVKEWMTSGRSTDDKTVFLTFDDGPGKYTEDILTILKEKEAPGTFFLLGKSAEKIGASGQVWKRYVEEGHGIALHTYSHDYGILYTERTPNVEKFKEEWNTSTAILKERLGENFSTKVLRFPGGSMSWRGMPEAKTQLEADNIIDIDWNTMTGDSESADRRPKTSAEAWDYIQDGLSRTSHPETVVLLMHDTKEDTAKFLGEIIDKFKEEGYNFGILY